MRTRLAKELRLLLPPVAMAVIATALGAFLLATRKIFPGQANVGEQLTQIAAIVGLPLIAASSFGAEFQHGTLTLMLAQPIDRARLWWEKWLTLVAVVLAVVAFQLAVSWPFDDLPNPRIAGALFLSLALCSAPLWTLVTKSTIGGFTLAGAAIGPPEFAMTYVYYLVTGAPPADLMFADVPVFHAVRVVIAAASLGAAWLLFSRIEPRPPLTHAAATLGPAKWTVLRPQPRSRMANLVRKELMLHRATFTVAAAFTISWLVACASVALYGVETMFGLIVFPLILAVYVPLAVVLAGTISASEERSLGIHAWHLTLPCAARTQWAIKLSTSVALGLVLIIVLPSALASVTAPLVPSAYAAVNLIDWRSIMLVLTGISLTFWAANVFGHAVRAAVATGAVIFAWAIACLWVALPLGETVGRQLAEVVPSLGHQAWPPRTAIFVLHAMFAGFVLLAVPPILWQSLVAFRQASMRQAVILRMSLLLVAIGCAAVFLLTVAAKALELA